MLTALKTHLTTPSIRTLGVATMIVFVLFVSVVVPIGLHAQSSEPADEGFRLVPCDGTPENPCNFAALVQLVQNIINWLIFISVPIAAGLFTWAGILYITAGGDPGKAGKAKAIFTTVGIGFAIILGAWLIVFTITSTLLGDNASDFTLIGQ